MTGSEYSPKSIVTYDGNIGKCPANTFRGLVINRFDNDPERSTGSGGTGFKYYPVNGSMRVMTRMRSMQYDAPAGSNPARINNYYMEINNQGGFVRCVYGPTVHVARDEVTENGDLFKCTIGMVGGLDRHNGGYNHAVALAQ